MNFCAKKCKQCGHTIFSFSEEALINMVEGHFMATGHTETIDINPLEMN